MFLNLQYWAWKLQSQLCKLLTKVPKLKYWNKVPKYWASEIPTLPFGLETSCFSWFILVSHLRAIISCLSYFGWRLRILLIFLLDSLGLRWRSRQSKRLSPLSLWVSFSLQTHVKRVSQRSAECCGFSPGAPVSSHKESWQGWVRINLKFRPYHRIGPDTKPI
jgi:hypothetical protein